MRLRRARVSRLWLLFLFDSILNQASHQFQSPCPLRVGRGVVQFHRRFRDVQWAEGVHHHREFVGPLHVAAGDDRAGVRAMRDAVRVQSA